MDNTIMNGDSVSYKDTGDTAPVSETTMNDGAASFVNCADDNDGGHIYGASDVVFALDAHEVADHGHLDVSFDQPRIHGLRAYWRRPRAGSFLEALRSRAPWAVRRLQRAALGVPRLVDLAQLPPPVELEPGAKPDGVLSAAEEEAIDFLVDVVFDDWLRELRSGQEAQR